MPKPFSLGAKVRQLREEQDLSREELAARARIDASFVEMVEQDSISPSLAPLLKIARALGVRLGTLLDDYPQTGPVITRAGAPAKSLRFSGSTGESGALDFFSLASDKLDRHMEPFLIVVEPGAPAGHGLSSHEGEEFLYVIEGAVEVVIGPKRHLIEAGDSIYYDSLMPHEVVAAGNRPAKMVAVVYTPF